MDYPIGLQIRGGTKVYPGTRALKSVDFDLRMGAVNVLVGENGAGKSTMMKVIAGVEQLTEGQILMGGREVQFRGTEEARRHGIGIVFQELNLFPNMTVAENIFIGREITRGGVDIDMEAQRAETRRLMQRLEHDIHPDTPVGELRVGQQQIIEIAKSLAQDARILILDEPTSALSAAEVEILFRVIAELKRDGVGIVYISHRLEELIRIGDYITVLRDGAITGARSMVGVDVPWIVRNMIGEASKDFAKEVDHPYGDEIFRAENICLPRAGGGLAVDHVSLSLRAGEIVGIYGLMGAGRSEFLECVIGRHGHATGRMFIAGQPLTDRSIAGRIARGIALIPEDRKNDGLIQIASIRENMSLSSLGLFTRIFHMDLGAERRKVADFVKRLTVKIASMENPVSSLSGGNQQKVVLAKWFNTEPGLIILDEPTRGVDVGAKTEIYTLVHRLAAEGKAVIIISSEHAELFGLCDRILVMGEGELRGELRPDDFEEEKLLTLSMTPPQPKTAEAQA